MLKWNESGSVQGEKINTGFIMTVIRTCKVKKDFTQFKPHSVWSHWYKWQIKNPITSVATSNWEYNDTTLLNLNVQQK